MFRGITGGAICFLLGALAYGLLMNRWGPKPPAHLPQTVIVKKAPAVAVTTTVARKSPAVPPTRPVAGGQADNDVTVPASLAVSGAVQSAEVGPAIVEILKPGYVHCSNLGVAANCNARPMVTYDMVRLWKFTGDLTAEIRPNPFAVTAAGVAALGDIGGSDRWYIGPYFQHSFEKGQTEAGICTGFRL